MEKKKEYIASSCKFEFEGYSKHTIKKLEELIRAINKDAKILSKYNLIDGGKQKKS